MKRWTITPFACIILSFISVPSRAAEVSCLSYYLNRCLTGTLSGPISKGDYDKVVTLLRANHPFLSDFVLVSLGGDVDEALKIGRLFRKYLVGTGAPVQLPDGNTYISWTECRGQNC